MQLQIGQLEGPIFFTLTQYGTFKGGARLSACHAKRLVKVMEHQPAADPPGRQPLPPSGL